MASDNPNYHSGLPLLWSLFWAKHAQNYENECSEESEVDNRSEKNTFYWPCEGYKSVASFLLLANFESESHHINTAWLPSTVQNGGLRSCFFREKFQDNWHHKFWWVKNRLFTCYRQRQNYKFVAATFSFKYILKRLKEPGHCLRLILCIYAVFEFISYHNDTCQVML